MSEYIEKAISKIEHYGINLGNPLYDQEDWLLGYEIIFKNKRESILLAAKQGHIVEDLGFVKSIDFLLCNYAKNRNKDILLYIFETDSFYTLSPYWIMQYMKENRKNNLKYSIKKLNDGLCPLCGDALSLHGGNNLKCAEQPNDVMFECFRHRLKFNKVPLNLCGARNINLTKTFIQSKAERWLDNLFKEEKLNLIFSGDKQIPIIQEIYGFFPDWIYPVSKKIVEYDGSIRKEGYRRHLSDVHKFDIFKITKNWKIYENNMFERRKLINDLRLFLSIDKQLTLGV